MRHYSIPDGEATFDQCLVSVPTQLRWFGYTMRRQNASLNKERPLEGEKKKRGKQKPTWKDGVLASMEKRNIIDDDEMNFKLQKTKTIFLG